MKFTKEGMEFVNCTGDVLVKCWPWKKVDGLSLYSRVHNQYFKDLKSYYLYLGGLEEACKKAKVEGFFFTEIIQDWVRFNYPEQTIVVLRDLDLGAKSIDFWRKMPKHHRLEFTKDMVILFCNTDKEMSDLIHSIESSFGEAMGFKNGELVSWNSEQFT